LGRHSDTRAENEHSASLTTIVVVVVVVVVVGRFLYLYYAW
jgi:hypothetical protein